MKNFVGFFVFVRNRIREKFFKICHFLTDAFFYIYSIEMTKI